MHYCPPRTHPLTHNSHLKSIIEHDISNNCYLASSIASYAENQGRDAPISAICRWLWRNGRMVRCGNARLRQRTISDGRLSQALSLASYNCKLAKNRFCSYGAYGTLEKLAEQRWCGGVGRGVVWRCARYTKAGGMANRLTAIGAVDFPAGFEALPQPAINLRRHPSGRAMPPDTKAAFGRPRSDTKCSG